MTLKPARRRYKKDDTGLPKGQAGPQDTGGTRSALTILSYVFDILLKFFRLCQEESLSRIIGLPISQTNCSFHNERPGFGLTGRQYYLARIQQFKKIVIITIYLYPIILIFHFL